VTRSSSNDLHPADSSVNPRELRIVIYPEPVLRRKALALPKVTDHVRAVAHRMIELMREVDGIGLAAPQVGLSWRMFVAEVPPNDQGRSASANPPSATLGPVVYINPTISNPHGPVEAYEEGCLSLPEIRGEVLRPPTVSLRFMSVEGEWLEQTATGLLARCWQHELDHLDGVLILDRMTQPSRIKNRSKIRELERDQA
jgi:peptide deformylase